MQSDCVFTASPTPSPTHPLSVPYTSPTSPTDVPHFQTFSACGGNGSFHTKFQPPPSGSCQQQQAGTLGIRWPPSVDAPSGRTLVGDKCMHASPTLQNHKFWAHVRRQQCIIIASESVPSEKTSPPLSPHWTPAPPNNAKLAAS